MPNQILILHGPDAENEANQLKLELENHSFVAITYQQAMKEAHLGRAILTVHEELVKITPAVVVLVSPGLLGNDFLVMTVQMAIELKRFLPVRLGFAEIKLPLWLGMYAIADLNCVGQDRDRQLNRLVESLMLKGL